MKANEIVPKDQKATENFTGDTWVHMLTVDEENFDTGEDRSFLHRL